MLELLFQLICGHFIADICLQSVEVSKQKNPHAQPPAAYNPKVHGPLEKAWPYYMAAHACVHASVVYYITESIELAVAEFILHYLIDTIKSYFKLSIHLDQTLHIICKIIYCINYVKI